MKDVWTIIFFALLAAAFGLAAWHDHQDKKRQEQKKERARRPGGGSEL